MSKAAIQRQRPMSRWSWVRKSWRQWQSYWKQHGKRSWWKEDRINRDLWKEKEKNFKHKPAIEWRKTTGKKCPNEAALVVTANSPVEQAKKNKKKKQSSSQSEFSYFCKNLFPCLKKLPPRAVVRMKIEQILSLSNDYQGSDFQKFRSMACSVFLFLFK